MRNYTKRDIYRLVEEEDVGFIRLQFTDIYGMMKNIAITTNQLEKRWITDVCLTVLPSRDLQRMRTRICICIRI